MMLNNLSLRTRLVMLIAAPVLLFLVLGIAGIVASAVADDRQARNDYDRSYAAAAKLHGAEKELLLATEALRRMTAPEALGGDRREQAAAVSARLAAAEAGLNDAARTVSGHGSWTAQELELIFHPIVMAAARTREGVAALAPLAVSEADGLGQEHRLAGMEPLIDAARLQVERATGRLDDAARRSAAASRSLKDALFLAYSAALLAAAGATAAYGALVLRSVSRSLSHVVGLASAVAAAELHPDISRVEREPDRLDELGETLGRLNDSLDRLVGAAGRIALPPAAAESVSVKAREAVSEDLSGTEGSRG